ncbi:hypothetical protein BH10PAT1_BH10PAT1_0160 [soil metagenome]
MKKYLLTVLILLILSVGLVVALFLVRQNQALKEHASSPTGQGTITLAPASVTHYVGETFPTTIKINTASSAISSLAFRISYPYSGSNPALEIVDSNGNVSNQIFPDSSLSSSGNWSFPIKSVTRANGVVIIDFAAINTTLTGFSASSDTAIATIYFKATAAANTNPIVLSFDPAQSQMQTKSNTTDILKTPVNASYTITADTIAPAAITNLSISSVSASSVKLNWTSPADIGPNNKASTYDIRYSTSDINSSNFASATAVSQPPVPGNSGTPESLTVNGLAQNIKYYFAIKSTDSVNNTSNLSNVVNTTTLSPTLTFGFKMQAISQANITKTVNVTLTNASSSKTYSVGFTSNVSGVFTPVASINLSGLAIDGSAFDVYIKDGSHLRKKLGSLVLTNATNSAPASWNNTQLLIGDFNDDNIINIIDVGKILSVYASLSIPVNITNQPYDVNSDGTINIVDVALALSNYTALTVNGD